MLASQKSHKNIKIISICLDNQDGARNIIEHNDDPRWNDITHYSSELINKESIKEFFEFTQVPFYVSINKTNSEITSKGTTKQVNLDNISGVHFEQPIFDDNTPSSSDDESPEDKENDENVAPLITIRKFEMDEDF